MARRLLCLALIASMLGLLLPPGTSVYACGPYFSEAVFTYSAHPDYPLAKFAGGQLGLLQPTYAQSYLIVAYRYLKGGKLNDAEQKSVESLWRARLAEYNYAATPVADPTKVWVDARAKYATTASPGPIDVYREVPKKNENDYEPSFVNCLQDAFATAATTIEQRATTYGAKSDALAVWIATQDAVFAQCPQPRPEAKPQQQPALPANPLALLQQDRAYQLASMQFYATDFDAAQKSFGAIAADSASPWRQTASLLVARSLIRKATLIDDDAQRTVDLRAAQAALARIAADPKDVEFHAAAMGLEGFVAFRLDPAARAKQLAAELAGQAQVDDLGNTIGDYTLLDAKYTEVPRDAKPAVGSGEDLMDWVNNFSVPATTSDITNHALARWNATHSLAWLVAAITQAAGNSPTAAALIEASTKIGPSSPAYVTVAFHRNRLLASAGKRDEARANLDAILANSSAPLPASARNMFLALRMQLATNLDDWLKYAVRTPALTITTDAVEGWAPQSEFGPPPSTSEPGEWDKPQPNEPLFDADSAIALTMKFPLATLATASKSTSLPESLRKIVTQSAWTRAVIMHDRAVALDLSPAMKAAYPDRAADIEAYATAKTEAEQNFAGALAILKTPGWAPLVEAGTRRDVDSVTGLSNYRQNWWCGWKRPSGVKDADYIGNDYENRGKISGGLKSLYPADALPSPEFLGVAERAQAEKEWSALAATGAAIEPLGTEVMSFAKSHPDDPHVPEALHRVVQVSRYGCYGAPNATYSKAAFDLLRTHYPDSEWTKKTPYWFK
jgi:hypothetical protein